MLLLIFFVFLFFLYYKKKNIVSLFILIQIVSLVLTFLVDYNYPIDSAYKVFHIAFTALILTLVIIPWKNFKNIDEITYPNEVKVRKLTKFLLVISLFMFIPLLIIAIYVSQYSDEINMFKSHDVFTKTLYKEFPILVKGYLLAYYLHTISYFLIILHFYHLKKKNFRLAVFCFVMSLNIVLFGFTFFSRWTLTNYILIYGAVLLLMRSSLSRQIRKAIRFVFIAACGVIAVTFVIITVSRFEKNVSYYNDIPLYSKIQDPVVYSYFSYMSQWYVNNMTTLDYYSFETLNGKDTFSPILSLMNEYHIINFNSDDYSRIRMRLKPNKYWTFNGLVSDWVFDYGYFITIILAIAYYMIIRRIEPKNRQISLINAFVLILLIQIPILAIFYSGLSGIVIAFLILIPINMYLRV